MGLWEISTQLSFARLTTLLAAPDTAPQAGFERDNLMWARLYVLAKVSDGC